MILTSQNEANAILILKALLIVTMWLMPCFLSMRFKVANTVILSQLVFGYVITCLIIPSLLIGFQKLFEQEGR